MIRLIKLNLCLFICLCFCFIIGCNKEVKFDVNFIVEGEIYKTVGTSGNEVIAIPADPVKDGYTFDGWYWDKDVWIKPFTANSLLNIELRENMNVYARFIDEDDPIGTELNMEGFELIESQDTGNILYGEVANSQVNFAFNDYVKVSNKASWTVSKDVSGNDIVNSKTAVLDLGNNLFFIQVTDETGKIKQYNIVVRRHLMYNVFFNTNGGTSVNNLVIEEDSLIEEPSTSRIGYIFKGWDYDFTEPITTNIIINAQWEAKQYKVTLDANGGNCSNSLIYATYDEYYTLPTPVKPGYTFSGWYYENIKVNDGVWKNNEDINLVAKWTANTYTISYILNGGSLNNKPSSYKTDSTIAIGNPNKTGYEFIGWSVNGSDDKHKDYEITNTYGDITLTANYKANTYNVTLDSNGGNCETSLLTVTYDESYTLPIPNKTGYKFDGWYNGSTKVENGVWNKTSSLDLKAKWSIANYTISYDLNGGINNANNPSKYTFESDNITLLDASKTGYTFIGWTTNEITVPTKNILIEKGSTGNVSFIANYTPNEYHITLDVNGGEELSNNKIKVVYENSYALPTPEKIGYEFKGWYDGDNRVNDGTWKLDFNVTLKAKWEIKTFKINYTLNGGVNNNENLQSYNYEYDDINIINPTKTGYTFNGWKVNGGSELIKDYVVKHNSLGDISLEAIFTSNVYKLKLDVNGGNDLNQNEYKINYDDEFVLPDASKTGYSFEGWYNGTSKVLGGTWKYLNDLELTAKWSITNYTITYNLDGGANNISNITKYNYESDNITILEPTKKGYTFIGWTYNDIIVPVKEVVIKHNSTGDITLNANFQVNTYHITYDVNGGNKLEEEFVGVVYGTGFTLETPTRDGYEFGGWYNGDTKITDEIWLKEYDITLTAKWSLVNYTISYSLDGGKNSTYNPPKYNYEYTDINIINPTKTGYTFIGWYINDNKELVTDYVIKHNSYGNLSLTANWKVNEYKLTYDVNGGEELDYTEINIKYNESYSLLIPTRIGYTFEGWYNKSTKVENGTWKYLEDIALTAKWNVINYNIKYNLDGGENNENNPLTYNYDDETIILQDPYKKGYTFIGWVTEEIFVPRKDLSINHNSLGELYFEAVFEVNIYTITFDVNGGDPLDNNKIEVAFGEIVELPIALKNGRSGLFIGWYYSDYKFYWERWEFEEDITLIARWNGIVYCENQKQYINLGEYPQSKVDDTNLISILNNITKRNEFGYKEYQGLEYQLYSGQYYVVEPIRWIVLEENNGRYKLISEKIIDCKVFNYNAEKAITIDNIYISPNNYMYSNIRAWLNGINNGVSNYLGKGFIDIAFNNDERDLIKTSLVDNSAATTKSTTNTYACSDTNDQIYLLSYKEFVNWDYRYRITSPTDYARQCGASTANGGIGMWWLRSPSEFMKYSYYRAIHANYGDGTTESRVNYEKPGVRPVIEVILQ